MTYYIIKSSNMTLEETYKILQMKRHYGTYEQAKEALDSADPDIIPKGSQIYYVGEWVQDNGDSLNSEIQMELSMKGPK